MDTFKKVADIFAGLVSVFTALGVLYIAYRQPKVTRDKGLVEDRKNKRLFQRPSLKVLPSLSSFISESPQTWAEFRSSRLNILPRSRRWLRQKHFVSAIGLLKRPGMLPGLKVNDIDDILNFLLSRANLRQIFFLWRPHQPHDCA